MNITLSRKRLFLLLAVMAIATTLVVSPIVYVLATSPSATLTISSGVYPGAPSYTVYSVGGTYYAKDQNGYKEFTETTANAVMQDVLNSVATNGGSIYVTVGNYPVLSSITIPYTSKSITIYGDGMRSTTFTASASMNAVFVRASTGAYADEITLRDFGVDCANGLSKDGLQLNDTLANECPKSITVEHVEVQGFSGYGINMDHNDNSVLIDNLIENPYGGLSTPVGKPLAWSDLTGDVKVIRGYYHPGDMEVAGQNIVIDTVQLSGIRVVGDSHCLNVISPETPNLPILSTNNFIEVASGYHLDDCVVQHPVVTLGNGANFVAGNFTSSITINNPEIYIAAGSTACFLPGYPTLTSKYYSGGVFARVYINGGGVFSSPAGTFTIMSSGFISTPGVNLMTVDGFMGAWGNNYRNGHFNEAAPGGSAMYKDITLVWPYCDGYYLVDVTPTGSGLSYVSSRNNTGFRINYNVPGGWAVDWIAIHTP